MSGFRLRQHHLHALYKRLADDDVHPGCLVAIDKDGKLCLATGNKPVVGVCCDAPLDVFDGPVEPEPEPEPEAEAKPEVAPKPPVAYYRALGPGEFTVDKPKPTKPRDKRLADNPTWAKLSRDCDDVEPAGGADPDFLVVDDLDGMWVVQLLARRRLT